MQIKIITHYYIIILTLPSSVVKGQIAAFKVDCVLVSSTLIRKAYVWLWAGYHNKHF